MEDFTFKVDLVAVVRVRADDESVARKVVPTVLGAPGTAEIRLANENNAARGHHATVTDVDFLSDRSSPLRSQVSAALRPECVGSAADGHALLVPWRLGERRVSLMQQRRRQMSRQRR